MQQPDESCHDFKTDISIKRLLCALKYYTTLDVTTNKQHQDIFIHFMKKIYTVQILDDYHFLTKHYDDDLEDIMEYAKTSLNIKSFDIANCPYSDRRYGVNQNTSNPLSITNIKDDILRFHVDVMDSLYFHVFHLYDANLRFSKKYSDSINEDSKDKKNHNEYFDKEFSDRLKIMSDRKEATARFERISNNPSKFTIQSERQYDDENITALDSIYVQLS